MSVQAAIAIVGWRIFATYTTCCFCSRPPMPAGELYRRKPTWPTMVRDYAERHGLTDVVMGKRGHAVATAVRSVGCQHRRVQHCRLERRAVLAYELAS